MDQVAQLVRYKRLHPGVELEVRVGQFDRNHKNFVSGYHVNYQPVITRLLKRLGNTCQASVNWTDLGQSMYVVVEHSGGIRQVCHSDQTKKERVIRKSKIAQLDLKTDREYDLRVGLASEVAVDTEKPAIFNEVRRGKPTSVRIVQRASFLENSGPYTFRYDISKVSPATQNKMQCTNKPCFYHCEVELTSQLHAVPASQHEDVCIAEMLLARGKALLGNHYITQSGNVKLPEPSLVVLAFRTPEDTQDSRHDAHRGHEEETQSDQT